jgi:hypothetical protein
MDSIKVGSRVKIKLNGVEGEVVGIYRDADGDDFNVAYANSQGEVCRGYFKAHQLDLL